MPAHRIPLLALKLIFALNATGLAMWFPRIPDVKAALGLDVMTLALCLFGMPAGTVLGFLAVGGLVGRIGVRATAGRIGAAFLLAFVAPALATGPASLAAALFLCGLTIAMVEVALNAKASQMESASGRRVMSSCHAFWSLGAVAGALIGGAFAQAETPFLTQQALLLPVLAALTLGLGRALAADAPRAALAPRRYARPSRALLALCLVAIGALLVEGAMMEWSALFLREDVGASPFATAATFAAFALAMAAGRLAGDRLAEAFGARAVILVSTLVMAASVLGFALSTDIRLAAPLATLTGLGCANIYPLAMSAAAPLPGQPPERNVATIGLIAFSAFLIGPPFVGVAASAFGLPAALALLAPLAAAPLAAGALLRTRAPEIAPPRPAPQPR